jgi:hypothetical protein
VDEGTRDNLVVESAKISNGDVLIDEAQSIIHEMKMRCWTWIMFYGDQIQFRHAYIFLKLNYYVKSFIAYSGLDASQGISTPWKS